MNTKTDGISSGLVAVAEVGSGFSIRWTEPDYGGSCKPYDMLVRLSDAEAIIAQKDAEILEQCRINGMGAERELALLGQIERQDERIKGLTDDLEESDAIRDRCAHLLAETAVALKGPEKALHRHGWQDLPEVAAKQSAALKLAREALFDMQDSYAAVHGWKDSFVIAATTAIAAIDALGEVK